MRATVPTGLQNTKNIDGTKRREEKCICTVYSLNFSLQNFAVSNAGIKEFCSIFSVKIIYSGKRQNTVYTSYIHMPMLRHTLYAVTH